MPASVRGKFDHLGIDSKGTRLFVAAETAHQVLVFDLKSGEYMRSIDDIEIPHAIFVRDDLNRIYITDGGSGALKIYDGTTYTLLKSIPLKVDADSIGYDSATHLLYIDNGGGDAHETYSILSIIDTTHEVKVADVKIDGDTLEAMALERSGDRMYVNDAAKNEIVVLNRQGRSILANWPVKLGKRNVAMALDVRFRRSFCRDGSVDGASVGEAIAAARALPASNARSRYSWAGSSGSAPGAHRRRPSDCRQSKYVPASICWPR